MDMQLVEKIQKVACDLNHYDSEDFTPPESIAEILNNQDVAWWLDSILKNCVALTFGKLEEITEEEKAMEPREPVKWFAEQMEITLRKNDHKTGWADCPQLWLLGRLQQEYLELCQASTFGVSPKAVTRGVSLNDLNAETIIKEATDIANFAMMIADNARRTEHV